jgi:glycosyltransferase involved in cell wall biosynthesis
MSPSATIVGPASPRALSDLLASADRERAQALSGLGGTSVNSLVRALVEAGTSVELVTLAREATDRMTLEGSRLRILVAPYRDRPRDRTVDLFKEERRHVEELVASTFAPVVHARWTYEFALGSLRSSRRPVVVTAGDAPFTILRYSPDLYRLGRTALAIMTRLRLSSLSAPSPHLAAAWRGQMAYRRPIRVIPHAIPAVPPREGGGIDDRPPTIVDVTNADRLKNVAALLRAMTRILKAEPEARCRLIGPGLVCDSYLGRLAEELGVAHAVDFVGPLDHERVRDEYQRATVFVHSSLEEAFGMSVAEAMSYGLPVVGGARSGAVPWVLGEGEAGVLVDVREPGQIASAVCRLLADRGLRADLGARAAAHARKAFSPEAVSAATNQLYEDAMRGRI